MSILELYRSRFGVDELSARLDEAGREIAALKAEIARLKAEAARRDWPVGGATGDPAPSGAGGGPTP